LSKHLGDYDTSSVIYGKFTTFRPSTGAAYTLAGTPALSVYKDNSTTQSTTGVTLTADFDSVTGLNHFAIDTSSDGTFYASGSFFDIVITTGTVDSVSVVGSVVASFTLRKDSSLKPTTAGRTLDVSAGGEAGVDWANVGSPTTTLALTGTTIATVTNLTNAATAGDLTATMKASVTTAATAATPTAAAVTGSVGSVVGLTASNLDATVSSRLASASYTAPDNASITGIKAKTDSLTFTVSGQVDANIQYVNDVQVTGDGESGTEWGPV
jgi:hypothetical protein